MFICFVFDKCVYWSLFCVVGTYVLIILFYFILRALCYRGSHSKLVIVSLIVSKTYYYWCRKKVLIKGWSLHQLPIYDPIAKVCTSRSEYLESPLDKRGFEYSVFSYPGSPHFLKKSLRCVFYAVWPEGIQRKSSIFIYLKRWLSYVEQFYLHCSRDIAVNFNHQTGNTNNSCFWHPKQTEHHTLLSQHNL